jgi:hypothetical protein
MNLPMVLSLVLVSIISGICVTLVGYCEFTLFSTLHDTNVS